VSVVLSGGGELLKDFDVPQGGLPVLLVVHAPGLRMLGGHRQSLLVPHSGDSDPVRFDLIADDPGSRRISVTAWDCGSYLGELVVEVAVQHDKTLRMDRTVIGEMRAERTEGEVTLVVRYDPRQKAYRFEFRDIDNPEEIPSPLLYEPGHGIERLVRDLDALAEGLGGYSAAETRDYLVNAGVELWGQLVPKALREQFWERQGRIKQLTILADKDVVPWELLYPKDPGHDAGFLVEQFPVTRAVFGWTRERRLRLHPTLFVVPGGSPVEAESEVQALRQLLDTGGAPPGVISDLTPLLRLIHKGDFGLLHFACHNRFDPANGSSIKLDSAFVPRLITTAAIDRTLAGSGPVVFINACRSAGQVRSYTSLDGWAEKFIGAGVAAFIGSLWEVRDHTAREFAEELYRRLQARDSLGEAVMSARRAAGNQAGDPTWLAYAVYGDPQARIS